MEQKCFAEKPGIAADDHSRAGGLLRRYVTGDSGDCASHIGESKFLGHDGTPSGGAELDLGWHGEQFSVVSSQFSVSQGTSKYHFDAYGNQNGYSRISES